MGYGIELYDQTDAGGAGRVTSVDETGIENSGAFGFDFNGHIFIS